LISMLRKYQIKSLCTIALSEYLVVPEKSRKPYYKKIEL